MFLHSSSSVRKSIEIQNCIILILRPKWNGFAAAKQQKMMKKMSLWEKKRNRFSWLCWWRMPRTPAECMYICILPTLTFMWRLMLIKLWSFSARHLHNIFHKLCSVQLKQATKQWAATEWNYRGMGAGPAAKTNLRKLIPSDAGRALIIYSMVS